MRDLIDKLNYKKTKFVSEINRGTKFIINPKTNTFCKD